MKKKETDQDPLMQVDRLQALNLKKRLQEVACSDDQLKMPNTRVLLFPLRYTADPQAVVGGNNE
jgi:hypothetical protein